MEKRFRLRISRIIPSFHFHSCCSKDPSNNSNSHSVPSFSRSRPVIPTVLPKHRSPSRPPLPSKPHKSSLKRHVSCPFACGNRSKPTLSDDDRSQSPPEYFRWEKEEKYWHVITTPQSNDVVTPRRKIYNSSAEDDDALPPPPPPSAEKNRKRRNKKKKKTTSRIIRVSTSSAESGLFSSEGFDDNVDDEETETLVSSSRSFSTDSLETIRESAAPDHYPVTTRSRKNSKKKQEKKKISKRRISECEWWSSTETSAAAVPARLSVFQRLIPCSLEGKVRESFAVVKRSEDPYEDFKKSMMEMILEKQMFNDEDLEQLLHCFLSLNSKHHHGAIVQAFIEIWEALFCSNSTRSSSATASSRRVSRAV